MVGLGQAADDVEAEPGAPDGGGVAGGPGQTFEKPTAKFFAGTAAGSAPAELDGL
ncbi:hypothetical protein Ato02nite_043860 [Paractinoplanes toevensis]|uniref:Uncharacterized protein n=1 Tax=Paractinoplanes toevensis TaxID=571911 RepID=A0A919TBX3_9ACTN|nr:hypothetical protein Ato02nite_043860 [Actinoplanes toevensis]